MSDRIVASSSFVAAPQTPMAIEGLVANNAPVEGAPAAVVAQGNVAQRAGQVALEVVSAGRQRVEQAQDRPQIVRSVPLNLQAGRNALQQRRAQQGQDPMIVE